MIISALTIVLIFIYFYATVLHGPCLIKYLFKIPCPNCGASRALTEILQFRILESFKYNILTFPLLIICIISYSLFFIDILKNKEYLTKFISFFIKRYYLIIVVIILSWIINIIRGV